MSTEKHYRALLQRNSQMLDRLVADSTALVEFTKTHNFLADFEKLKNSIASRPESEVFSLAIREYNFALSAAAFSHYRHAHRQFLENQVLPEIKNKNDQYLAADKKTSAYFWIHRDSPAVVKEALRALCYTGVVSEQSSGIKATRAEIGTRYMVNLGCLFAQESTPTTTAFGIAKGLDLRRMTEFGANHVAYKGLLEETADMANSPVGVDLVKQLSKPIEVLDLTFWQKSKLRELKLNSVGEVLQAPEQTLKKAYYVGEVRARRMRNAAVAAVLEYLSG